MNIKQVYRRLVPKRARECIASLDVVQHWRNQALVREGECLAAEQRTKKNPKKLQVAFLEHVVGFWANHASIYRAMCEDAEVDAWIVAVPQRMPAGGMDWKAYRRLMDFFDQSGIPYRQAYDLQKERWINLLEYLLPDVVFYSVPYDFHQNFLYSSWYLKRFSTLAINHYGCPTMPLCLAEEWNRGENRFNFQYFFASNEDEACIRMGGGEAMRERIHVTGHPILDGYMQAVPEKTKIWRVEGAHRLIWAPHFTVAQSNAVHHMSNFLEDFDLFIQLAQQYPKLEIVMRPHPNLFPHLLALGICDEKGIQTYQQRFSELPNTQIYEGADYLTLFRQSDAMILDSVSFIAAYAPTLKPICFREHAGRSPLNYTAERLMDADYSAWDAEEIREFVEEVVLKGNDWRRAEREKAVRKVLYFPEGGAGRAIAKVLKEGWKKKQVKS